MSNRRKARGHEDSIPATTVSVRRWQIRIRVSAPWDINDAEVLDRQDFRDVMERCMVTCARASHMVNGPNREVLWAIDLWDSGRQTWRNVCNGRTKLKERPLGYNSPLLG